MCLSPKLDQFVKMGRRYPEDMFYIASARIGRSNRVRACCQSDLSRRLPKFHNYLNLCIETMYVRRLVSLGVCDKSNSVEP